MSLTNTVVRVFMILLAIQTVVEYFFYWDAFEKKFGSEFKRFPRKLRVLRNFLMLLYAIFYQWIRLVGALLCFTSLLVIYVYGPPFLRHMRMLFVYYHMRLRWYLGYN